MAGIHICAGCKHNWYSAIGGTDYKKSPHSRCLHFQSDIPIIVERKKGCDGTFSNEWVRSETPPDCPTFPLAGQSAAITNHAASQTTD